MRSRNWAVIQFLVGPRGRTHGEDVSKHLEDGIDEGRGGKIKYELTAANLQLRNPSRTHSLSYESLGPESNPHLPSAVIQTKRRLPKTKKEGQRKLPVIPFDDIVTI